MASDLNNNPIIPGFAPDPSICLIGNTYFLVNSNFHLFPGIPIYASPDLISWTHIGIFHFQTLNQGEDKLIDHPPYYHEMQLTGAPNSHYARQPLGSLLGKRARLWWQLVGCMPQPSVIITV